MVGRLLLRLVVVPFGCACAIARAAVIVLAYWHAVQALLASKSPAQGGELVFVLASVPVLAAVLAVIAVHMFMSAGVGVLISEALAIRSWIFHGANGSVSAWLGWTLFSLIKRKSTKTPSKGVPQKASGVLQRR